MSREKKLLMWFVALTGMFQMPTAAVSAAVNTIVTEVFPAYTLAQVQTSMSCTGIVSPIVSILMAWLIRQNVLTRRTVVIFGLGLLGMGGILIFFIKKWFWCLLALAILVGTASGCYVSTAISLIFGRFDVEERRKTTGMHSVFVGLGGVIFSAIGGVLVNLAWYAGYVLLLIGIPMSIFGMLAIPKETRTRQERQKEAKSKLNPDIFYYVVIIMVFMMVYNVGGGNISTHLANSGIKNYAMYAGFATAAQMAGTAVMSLFFSKISEKLDDMIIPLAFLAVFVGFTIVSVFHNSLVMIFIGIFLMGTSMPCLGPQCLLSISKRVDDSTSSFGTALANGLGPGIGAFLSPVIFTNLTTALAGNNTVFRYQFVAFVALALGAVVFVLNLFRQKKAKQE